MSSTNIKGRKILVKQLAEVLFAMFSDLSNFSKSVPADVLKGNELIATQDTVVTKVQGFEIGLKVAERVPFSLIKYEQYGNSPFPFVFFITFDERCTGETELMIELETELSGMLKMMLGGKLKELVDKVTNELELNLNRK